MRQWLFNGKGTGLYEWSLNETLVLNDIEWRDGGQYTCLLKSKYFEIYDRVNYYVTVREGKSHSALVLQGKFGIIWYYSL